MPLRRPGKVSVQAHRYNLRRLEHALTEGESVRKGFGGPGSETWTTVGAVAGSLLLAGSAVYGILKPAPSIGKAHVVVDGQSGTPYVISHGTIYPAMNLASALLAGSASNGGADSQVTTVDGAAINKYPRGQLIGIPGAPNSIASKKQLLPSRWAACDDAASTKGAAPNTEPSLGRSAYVGVNVSMPSGRKLDASKGVLVSPDGSTVYLVTNGSRIRLASGDDKHGLAALGKSTQDARPISLGLLNAIPERGSVTQKSLQDAGKSKSIGPVGARIGDVVQTVEGKSVRFYAVLSDGLEAISPVQADIMRSLSHQGPNVSTVSPGDVARTPSSTTDLGLNELPQTWPTVLPKDDNPVMCLNWASPSSQSVVLGASVPSPHGGSLTSVPPQQGKTSPALVDKVFVPAGHGLVIGASGDGSTPDGPVYYISDQGIAYHVSDDKAIGALGLSGQIKAGSSYLVSMLPQGPDLDPDAARKVYRTGHSW